MADAAPKTFEFTLILRGLDFDRQDDRDRLFEAGCDDAVLGIRSGWAFAAFDREATDYAEALLSAAADVQRAGAEVYAIEPDSYVTQADISSRSGLTRQAISQYVSGKRGKHFPLPARNISTGSTLWLWPDVAAFLFRQGAVEPDCPQQACLNWVATEQIEVLADLAPADLVAAAALRPQWITT
ncbi:MAG: hypothetical protein ACPG4M_04140 [Alphaproteobacteria bacterium]